uniref:Protein regulator of cytokinesis 1 n=1 Tax=Anthurium amnicola TaxID=1678845 RepID=A0A1D1Z0E6_9ARAE
MDALHFKVDQLKLLWQEYRIANESSSKDYSDHGEWAREKLQTVLTEFDKLIQEQILWKSTLAAEIEDMFSEIEEYCQIFGRRVDILIDQAASLSYEVNNATRDRLVITRDTLKEEYEITRSNVDKWLVELNIFVQELDVDYIVPSAENFENDLSTAVVRPLWCKYDEYSREVGGLRGSFENSAIKLHYLWEKLNYKPQDEIDRGLAQLFLDKSVSNELYESLIQNERNNQNKDNENSDDSESEQKLDLDLEKFIYYTPQLPEGLKLKPEHLEILKNKLTDLEKDYEERKDKMAMMQRSIKNLYDELEIPEEERIKLTDSLDQEYLDKLEAEFERLREIMRAKIQKAIEEYTLQLGELWDKCLVPQYERDEFFSSLRALVSAEEVYELLAQEVDRLQDLYVKCAKIYRLMLERRALIEKMIEFEKSASDPRRLFQPSFRLLEEEKWRKSCWPNLVKIEDQLINACIAYEEAERKPFMHESKRYLDTLQSEISERIVNQMFFGFEQQSGKKEEKEKENPKNSAKRRDSRVSASRPVSPTFSVNGDVPQRRSTAASRPVSPTSGTRSRRNSQVPKMSISRATSPSGFGTPRSRRNSQIFPPSRGVSPARSVASSRAVSPARSEISTPSRRRSMYLSSPVESTPPTVRTRTTSTSSTSSKRTSLYMSNSTNSTTNKTNKTNKTNGTNSSNKSNKPAEDKSSRRRSLYLDTQRSDSVSSSSSESSSVSSVSTPTTPEPSQTSYVVNGRLGVPTSTKIKVQSPNEAQSKSNIRSTTKSSLIPSNSRPTITRRSNTAPAKPRPRSTIVMSDEPSAMLKKQATKRMSMIIEGGH